MSASGTVQLLFALALVMAGLGLSLRIADFRRIFSEPRTVALAIALQTLVLPLVAFGLATGMHLSTPYAVGLMLLASAPGSISANLYSQVFGGNVALSVSLAGINTLLSMLTLPVICGWALAHFAAVPAAAPSVVGKLVEVMAVLVIPVGIGMLIRARAPKFAARAEKPMRVFSVLVLVVFCAGAIVKEWAALLQGFREVGVSVVVFNVLSLGVGYGVSRASGAAQANAVAIAFELGIRSAVLSMYVAMTVLNDYRMALPAAVYSVTMVFLGMSFGLWVRRRAQTLAPIPIQVSALS